MTKQEPELPPGVAIAWGLKRPRERGPRPELSIDTILTTAIEIADEGGLEALSMSRIAKELGYTTMSLYRYVRSKEELVLLAQDAALEPIEHAAFRDLSWREGLRLWSISVREVMLRHPWMLTIPIEAPPLLPNNLTWLDRGLGCLAGVPLRSNEKIIIVLLLGDYIRAEAKRTSELTRAMTASGNSEAERDAHYWTLLSQLVQAETHPHLRQVIDDDTGADWSSSDFEFEFGLQRVLDGIAALIATRSGKQLTDTPEE